MHSRIFQVSLEPITVEDYVTESDFYDIRPDYMDYIVNSSDREGDIEWLKGFLDDTITVENEKIIITKEALKEIIDDKLDKLRAIIENSSFSSWFTDSYHIKSCINDKFGFHIYVNGYMETLDEWLDDQLWRFDDESVKEVVFYIGAILDFHS